MAGGPIRLNIVSKFNNKGINNASGSLKKFGAMAGKIGLASVVAIGAIGGAALKMSAEFETSFAKIKGLVGVASSQIGALEEAAKTLGPQFGKSANEAAEALFYITSAGLRGNDAIVVLEASLKGAAAGLGDTKTIADLATSAVNAYGAAQLDGAKAVDVLTEAVREGKLEPAELAGAMGQVLPISSALGVGFDEVGAAMAAMSRTGTDASTAATQLRQILATLAKPTSEAEASLAGMGLSAEGLRTQIKEEGLLATLETLTGAFDGNIEATTSVFGNIRALSGVLDLMGSNVEGTRAIFNNMTDDIGALDEAFAATEETVGFKFAKAMETAKAQLLPIGDIMLGIAASVLDDLGPVIATVGVLLQDLFTELGPVISDLLGSLPALLQSLSPIIPIIGDIARVFMEIVSTVLPPVIALLDVLMPMFADLTGVLAEFIGDALEMLAPVLMDIADTLQPIIEAAFPVFMKLLETIIPIVLELIEMFLPLLDYVLPLLEALLVDVVIPALGLFAEMMSVILPLAMEMFTNFGLGRLMESLGKFSGDFEDFVYNMRVAWATTFNLMIDHMENWINGALRGLEWFIDKANSLPGVQIDFDASQVSFDRLDLPGKYDNMRFGNVDTTGVRDVLGRYSGGPFDSGGGGMRERGASSFFAGGGLNTTAARTALDNKFGINMFGAENFQSVSAFAKGGIVTSPLIGMVGEAGPEAIIPLDKANGLGSTYNITVNAGMGSDGARVGEAVIKAIKSYERSSGPVFARA